MFQGKESDTPEELKASLYLFTACFPIKISVTSMRVSLACLVHFYEPSTKNRACHIKRFQ